MNLYSYYNKTDLDNDDYRLLIQQLVNNDYSPVLSKIKHIIKKDPYYAYQYASKIIKGRWFEAEPFIMAHSTWASEYAVCILERRWLEAEPAIMRDAGCSIYYSLYIIKGRWYDAEPIIMQEPQNALMYAVNVIQGRWHEAEPILQPHKGWWKSYCDTFHIDYKA